MFQDLGDDTRSRILRGAATAFMDRGIRATSVQEILNTAGVSRRTYYQYFSSKEGVMLALYELAVTALIDHVRAAVEAESHPVKQVVVAIENYVEFQRQGGPTLIALQAEAICTDSPLGDRREETLNQLVKVLDEGVSAALGRSCDPIVYRSVLMGIEGMVIHLQRGGIFSAEDSARVQAAGIPILLQVINGVSSMPSEPV